MRLYQRPFLLAAMALVPSIRGVPDTLERELVSTKVNSYVRRKGTSNNLKKNHRHLLQWETDRFLYEIIFKEDAAEPTEDDLDCLEEGIRANMARIATDYLIKELNYPSDTVWGKLDEVEYREAKAKLEKEKAKILKELEKVEQQLLKAQEKLDKEVEKFEEENEEENEEIAEIMSEMKKETLAIKQQSLTENEMKDKGKKEEDKGKGKNEDDISKMEKRYEEKLLEKEKRLEQQEKELQKTEEKMFGKLKAKQKEKQEELQEVLQELEELDKLWGEITGQINCRKKNDAKARRRCRKRYQRFQATFAVKARCTFCRPEDSDSGRYLLDEATFKSFQGAKKFAFWMEDKMTDELKRHCRAAKKGVDFVVFSYDDEDQGNGKKEDDNE